MAEKKTITRKVISPSKKDSLEVKAPVKEAEKVVEENEAESKTAVKSTKRVCYFCQSKTNPSYTDMNVLKRFVTDRAKIVAKAKSNLCSKHQRFVTKQIKYARHLALLPFTPKV